MIDITELIPRDLHQLFIDIGRVGNWLSYHRLEKNNEPRVTELPITGVEVHWELFNHRPDISGFLEAFYTKEQILGLSHIEACARLLADGPKLFRPTVEQFESMQHVELRLSPSEFRAPYEAIVIQVPSECRIALSRTYEVSIDDIASQVLVRTKEEANCPTAVLVIVPAPKSKSEEHYLFTDQPLNPTIETVLNRFIDANDSVVDLHAFPNPWIGLKVVARDIARAALNLCLMLTHYGYHTGGPLDPVAYAKHRSKKRLEHLKHGDYLTVNMKQEVVLRRHVGRGINPQGPGTGIELPPRWRRGHWRAYPGQGALRAAGQQVPLLFVRPCLVRRDRVKGDLSQSSTTYIGQDDATSD